MVLEYFACPADQKLFEPLFQEQQLTTLEAQLSCLLGVVLSRSAAGPPPRGAASTNNGGGVLNSMSLTWPTHSANSPANNTPILIFLSIELSAAQPTCVTPTLNHSSGSGSGKSSGSASYAKGHSTRTMQQQHAAHIHNLVSSVNSIANRLMNSCDAMHSARKGSVRGGNTNRQWYVQPIDANRALNQLRCGVFAGLNWLLRAINQQNES